MNGYSDGKPEEAHWGWSFIGAALAVLMLSWAGYVIGGMLA